MRYLYLEKKNLSGFIEGIKKCYTVVAPVKKENQFVFATIDDVSKVTLDYLPTILPPKKYFTPQIQKLGSFKTGDIDMSETTIEMEPMVIFGAHTCDIEGIECLDIVFNESPADPYFRKLKKSVLIIGYECMKPCDEFATCITMDTHNPKAGYDIMLTDIGDKFIAHINSKQGEELISRVSVFYPVEDERAIKTKLHDMRSKKTESFKVHLDAGYKDLTRVFSKSYDSKVWNDDIGKKCVSCGNCTAVCPTCYCFDIKDSVRLDMSGGERSRIWDSCQLEEFATVAGGENFREERSSRQKHRYYRKFSYSVKKFNKFFCVGCGRCTRTCMAGISLIETLNSLTKEYKDGE